MDMVFGVEPTPAARKLRELFYSAHFAHSHIAHFYALAAPDFVLGPDADPAVRNILGVIGKVGLEIGGEVIKHRAYAQQIQAMLGGKATHPAWTLPGGVSKGLTEEERKQVEEMAKSCVEFAKFSLKLFDDVVLKNQAYVDLIVGDAYKLVTNYMGMVDENNKINFYDGKVRVVDTEGKELFKYSPREYVDHIAEHVEPYSYLKYPYLRRFGWTGFTEGPGTAIYQAAPLGRINACDGMATPVAQEAYEKFFSVLGGRPTHAVLATHWARLVELMYAAERLLELAQDEELTSSDIRNIPTASPKEGVGILEAPRGTLTHHYATDSNGIVVRANMLVGTTNNNAPISMAIKKAATSVIKPGEEITNGVLNMVEMAFRAYDPCFSCATHAILGELPLHVNIYDSRGELVKTLSRE
jgi:F420-non-reducing hydrogenase large subunit